MIIDTSAVISILRADDDAAEMAHAMEYADTPKISAATYLEAAVVVHSGRDPLASRFAYAFAKVTGEPLLFKGNDLSRTDIAPALPSSEELA